MKNTICTALNTFITQHEWCQSNNKTRLNSSQLTNISVFLSVANMWKSIKSYLSLISLSCSPQPDTRRNCKTTYTGLVCRVVCPFTPELSLVLINRPRRHGTLSWPWYTAAVGGIRTRDLAIVKSDTLRHGHGIADRTLDKLKQRLIDVW